MTDPDERRRRRRDAYVAHREPRLVEIPDLPFLVLPGRGDAGLDGHVGGPASSLLRLSRATRFVLEQGPRRVARRGSSPVEIVGWRPSDATGQAERWLLMVAQPDEVTPDVVDRARTRVAAATPREHLEAVRLVHFSEGLSVQALHRGGPDDVDEVAQNLGTFIVRHAMLPRGRQHLILLRDRGRHSQGERTIVRQPVRPQGSVSAVPAPATTAPPRPRS